MIRFHDNSGAPTDRFQVLGDRNSGTNYLHHLLVGNLPELQATTPYYWKHGFVDRRVAAEPGLLTVVIYRHPLRWLHAMHRRPWDVSSTMRDLTFSAFIRSEWRAVWTHGGREELLQGDMQPHTTTPFANVLLMRSAKIEWLEKLAGLPGKTAFVRYEDLNHDPLGCLRELAAGAGLAPVTRLSPVRAYKGDRSRLYAPRRQPATHAQDNDFIASQLNMEQEVRIGYDLASPPRFDGLPWWDRRTLKAR
jgi:hypothetical protein